MLNLFNDFTYLASFLYVCQLLFLFTISLSISFMLNMSYLPSFLYVCQLFFCLQYHHLIRPQYVFMGGKKNPYKNQWIRLSCYYISSLLALIRILPTCPSKLMVCHLYKTVVSMSLNRICSPPTTYVGSPLRLE